MQGFYQLSYQASWELGLNVIQAWIFFQASFSQLLKMSA